MENNLSIGEFILQKIKESGVPKSHVYNHLNMTEAGFRSKLTRNNVTIDNYISIMKFLSINPLEFFQMAGFEKANNVLTEPEPPQYGQKKESELKNLLNEQKTLQSGEFEIIMELLKQNTELIATIRDLSKQRV